MTGLLTVIVPMYNVGPFVRGALESLERQTYNKIEVIIVDDGSTDESLEIAKSFAEKNKIFKIVSQPNGGYGKAMNHGLALANGEYIGILEPDDYADPLLYETLMKAALNNQAEIARVDFYSIFRDQSNNISKSNQLVRKNNLSKFLPPGAKEGWINLMERPDIFASAAAIWTSVFNLEFLKTNQIHFLETPGASFQDFPFFAEALFCAEKVYAINNPLVFYRDSHPNSSSAMGSNKGLLHFKIFDYVFTSLQKRNPTKLEKIRPGLEYAFFRQHYFHYLRLDKKNRATFFYQLKEKISGHFSGEAFMNLGEKTALALVKCTNFFIYDMTIALLSQIKILLKKNSCE